MTVPLRADEIQGAFGSEAGVLPDGWIEGSDTSDWPLVVQSIPGDGLVARWFEDGSPVSDGDVGGDSARTNDIFAATLPGGVQVDFFLGDEVMFDIDLRETVSQVAVDAMCAFIARIGTALPEIGCLGTPEGGSRAVVRFDPATDEFTLPPQCDA